MEHAYQSSGRNDDARRRFVDFVRVQAMDDTFISREEEKRILQEGMMRFNLSLEEARGTMLSTASEGRIVMQREAEEQIADYLEMLASQRPQRQISETEFNQAVEMYRVRTRNRVPEPEIRRRVKAVMDSRGMKPRRSGWIIRSRKWYKSI